MRTHKDQGLIRVHRFLPSTEVEGPGVRAALWVQGCPIRCPGCGNLPTWSFAAGELVSVAAMFKRISNQKAIEGVTFVGGEPFSQARVLASLGRLCRKHGLSVVTFTGYEHSRLVTSGREDWNNLLAVTDLLLAGPFREDLKDFSRPWVGSRNQEVIFLTDRYRHLESQGFSCRNSLETQIASDGAVRLNGLVPVEDIRLFRQELALLGLQTH